MSLLEMICKGLNIEVNKSFYGVVNETTYNKYKLSDDGDLYLWRESINGELDGWYDTPIKPLLTGKIKPVWIPEIDELYFYPAIHFKHLYVFTKWQNDIQDLYRLEKGFVFKNKQDAIDKAKEILELIEE